MDLWWQVVKQRNSDETAASGAGDTVTPDEDMTGNDLAREFKR